MSRLQPLVQLLNGFSDERFLWQSAFGRKEYVDAFGERIPAGRQHCRKTEPTAKEDEVRLSAPSMEKLVKVVFTHNREAIEFDQCVKASRLAQMRNRLNQFKGPRQTAEGASGPHGGNFTPRAGYVPAQIFVAKLHGLWAGIDAA